MDFKKKKCGHCRKHFLILIQCSLCHREFCIHDRTPETHLCEKLNTYKKIPMPLEKIFTPKVEYI